MSDSEIQSVQGFWRQCKGFGKDPDGRPVFGKTWVLSHTRYNDKPQKDSSKGTS